MRITFRVNEVEEYLINKMLQNDNHGFENTSELFRWLLWSEAERRNKEKTIEETSIRTAMRIGRPRKYGTK